MISVDLDSTEDICDDSSIRPTWNSAVLKGNASYEESDDSDEDEAENEDDEKITENGTLSEEVNERADIESPGDPDFGDASSFEAGLNTGIHSELSAGQDEQNQMSGNVSDEETEEEHEFEEEDSVSSDIPGIDEDLELGEDAKSTDLNCSEARHPIEMKSSEELIKSLDDFDDFLNDDFDSDSDAGSVEDKQSSVNDDSSLSRLMDEDEDSQCNTNEEDVQEEALKKSKDTNRPLSVDEIEALLSSGL
jgi:hypothetical protein